MFKKTTCKKSVPTFKHFTNKRYAIFCSLKREVRIGCLAISTLACAHNGALASRIDSLRIIQQQEPQSSLSEVIVSARVPVPLEQSAQKVQIITRQDVEKASVQSVNDLLKLCASVDVRQRGAMGIQTDIGVGGGTQEQVCILLNGIPLNNPQTGHLTADFPVDLDEIEQIEVYDGASARYFGSQALNGAINIITRIEKSKTLNASLLGGSYGTLGTGTSMSTGAGQTNHHLSAGYLRSDGATQNSQFEKMRGFYQLHYEDTQLRLQAQAGYSGMQYGANTFYSAAYPNQWERNNRFMASFKAHTKQGRVRLDPTLSWIRSYDHFQLVKGTTYGENFHRNDVFTAGLSAYTHWSLGRTAWGGELRHDAILSTSLGKPLTPQQYVKVEGHNDVYYDQRDERTNVNFFLEHLILLRKFSISFGAMANRNSAVNDRFSIYPGADVSYRPTQKMKLYLSFNKSLRLPTFTDLYYKSVTQEGNVGLQPEKMTTYKLGAEYTGRGFSASTQGMYRKGNDMIDWVMYAATDDKYYVTQFRLDNYEWVTQMAFHFNQLIAPSFPVQSMHVSYMYNYQKRKDDVFIYKSCYALEYLRHKLLVDVSHPVCKNLSATWYWQWQERMGGYLATGANGSQVVQAYSPYSLLNVKLNYTRKNYKVFLSLENLTNHTYYDFGSVPQPGFTFTAGVKAKLM